MPAPVWASDGGVFEAGRGPDRHGDQRADADRTADEGTVAPAAVRRPVLTGAERAGTRAPRGAPPPGGPATAPPTAGTEPGAVPSIPVQRAFRHDERPGRASGRAPGRGAAGERGATGEREPLSVLMVRSCPAPGGAAAGPPTDIAALITDSVEYFGGRVSATHGPVSLAVFGGRERDGDAAECAVMASLTIGDESRTGATGRTARQTDGPVLRTAVVSGEALVRHRLADGTPVTAAGALLDRGRALLARTHAGAIRVCDDTRRATESAVVYHRGDRPGEWAVGGVRREAVGHGPSPLPLVDRESELELLRGLEELSGQRSHAQLVTVLGEAGTGKSRLLAEFGRRTAGLARPAHHRVPAPGTAGPRDAGPEPPGTGANGAHAIQCELVNALCGILPDDPPQRQMDKLLDAFRQVVDDAEERLRWLRTCLVPFIHPRTPPDPGNDPAAELAEWREFLERTELTRPRGPALRAHTRPPPPRLWVGGRRAPP
ncbi:hypothetical protein ACFW15_21000, partial [Streptomyces sp. NPDC058953]